MQSYSAHGYEVLDIAVTDDNARFASVGGDRQVFLWDVATGKTLRRWAGHGGRVNAVDFGGDGASVVISGRLILCLQKSRNRAKNERQAQSIGNGEQYSGKQHIKRLAW